jgi:hypothetical protein
MAHEQRPRPEPMTATAGDFYYHSAFDEGSRERTLQ